MVMVKTSRDRDPSMTILIGKWAAVDPQRRLQRVKMKVFLILSSLLLICTQSSHSASLEVVTDDELLSLFKTEKYVVVLFTKKDCEQCDNFENELIHLREDLVDTLNAWVVKAVNSQLVRLYNPNKEPALVFFRHGIPLLYDGPVNDELILHTFTENKEPAVKELSDDNFEHLTQASSGATTGDWFIMFFRQGNLYRYNIHKYDVASFTSFVTDWYKNARREKVPVPKSPFDDFLQMIVDYLRDNPWIWKIGFGSVGFTVLSIIIIISKLKAKKPPVAKKTKKSK
ncbi:hypothetical protein C0J52_00646 [Blattella germanica]|nr:hypothetical protein C0J52_00646 [Blattella germanica]